AFELVQDAVESLPVAVPGSRIVCCPGLDFLYQRQSLRAMFSRLCLDLVEPGFHHLVRLVAGVIEALPQSVVGRAALVGLFPLLAQRAKLLLHLAPAIARLARPAFSSF